MSNDQRPALSSFVPQEERETESEVLSDELQMVSGKLEA